MMEIERRFLSTKKIEIRADENEPTMIRGYTAVFNQTSLDVGGFFERIDPGAFSNAILADDVRALSNHDDNFVLGRNTRGTLRMIEDDTGLAVEIQPPDAQWARDLIVSINRGDVDQMSFGFWVEEGGDRWEMVDGVAFRTLTNVRLRDVSIVTFPAYPQTTAQVRTQFAAFSQAANADLSKAAAEQAQARLSVKRLKIDIEKSKVR